MDMHKAGYSAGYYTSKIILDTDKFNKTKLGLYDVYDNDSEYIAGFEEACIECRRQIKNNGSRFHIKEIGNERN